MKLCATITAEPVFAGSVERPEAAEGVVGIDPGTWVSPYDFTDADAAWTNEENVYDGNVASYATADLSDLWLELLWLSAQECIGIRWMPQVGASYTVDIHTPSGWVNVFSGMVLIPVGTWKNVYFDRAIVDKARFKTGAGAKLYEVDILPAYEMDGVFSAEPRFAGDLESESRFAGEIEIEARFEGDVARKECS